MREIVTTPVRRFLLPLILLGGIAFIPESIRIEAAAATMSPPSAAGSVQRRKPRRKRRTVRRRQLTREETFGAPSGPYPIAPDKIEVIEHGAVDSPTVHRLLNPPKPPQSARAVQDPDVIPTGSTRRINVRMESSRVQEIQQALLQRGVYAGDLTGIYDEETIRAMRQFQAREKIPVTGYPTAHALKRLGLAN